MKNIRIKSQNRFCYVGSRKYEYFDVLADSERFGENAIMCQGTFPECIAYLERCGVDYFEECYKRNRGRDVQVSFRMYEITGRNGDQIIVKGRDGFYDVIDSKTLYPVAPFTFKMSPGVHGEKTSTVKMMTARAW